MALSKKNMLFGAAGIVLLILVGIPAVLLYQGISRFSQAERDLRRSVNTLKQHYRSKPFPSSENVEQGRRNIALLDEWFHDLLERLSRGQEETADRSPTSFMGLLSDTQNRLLRLAEQNRTTLPKGFAFGFERYDGGIPPSPSDVPRLTRQLAVVEAVSRVLFAVGAEEIVGIRREVFEAGAAVAQPGEAPPGRTVRPALVRRPVAGRPPARPAAGVEEKTAELEEGVEGVLRFTFEFKCREQTLRRVLNVLARLKLFVVVGSVQIDAEGPDVGIRLSSVTSGGETAALEAAVEFGRVPSRRERIVCGPEVERPMRVKLDLDVYRFRGPETAD